MNNAAQRFGFHSVHGLDRREEVTANTRAFKGDGTEFLKVPGLLRVDGVKCGRETFPENVQIEFPVDHTLRRLESLTLPTVVLEHMQDGTPVLLRNVFSNDGMWQENETFYVCGEWDPQVAEEPLPEPEPKAKKGR